MSNPINKESPDLLPLRVLIVEDAEDDALLLVRTLRQAGYDLTFTQVDTAEAMAAALAEKTWDLVVSDYSMPHFSALAALMVLKKSGFDIPFIVLSGNIGEETAVESMRAGAHDYVMKGNTARLLPAIDRELREATGRLQRRRAEETLLESEQRFRSIFLNAITGMTTLSAEGGYLQVNPAFCKMLQCSEEELVGKTTYDFTHPADVALTRRLFQEAADGQRQSVDYEKRFVCKNGDTLWAHVSTCWLYDDQKQVTYCISLVHDITPHLQAQQEIRQLAYFDTLTGLPNRQLFRERCVDLLNQVGKNPVGVLILDLDRFKGINDTFGHDIGDQLLQEVSERLTDCLEKSAILARLGPDEFAVVLPDIDSPENLSFLAEKILIALSAPIELADQPLYCSASIGLALYPTDGGNVDTLVKHAGVALHKSKEQGVGCYRFYSPEMNLVTCQRLAMETHLRQALERQELSLHYQPQIDLGSGRVIGMEALLRWDSPALGSVSPVRFIPLAEETGLILSIGEWVLETACKQAKKWHQAGFDRLRMAVNISACQFKQADFIDRIDRILQTTDLDPEYLEIELTESIVMERSEETLLTLTDLKVRGIKLAIDDFGTGYSMLSYLKHFPIDRIKIDRSFVRDITTDSDDAAITEAIVVMAHSLKLKVVAEGVETEEQLEFLRRCGCEEVQGYYFSRPHPVDRAELFLSRHFADNTK
jgi:diguanylate cyclase (GGDEF)-like protein/PAS domain S-box-containing protein